MRGASMTIPGPASLITCSRCGQAKPPDAFNVSKSERNGRQSRCRSCQRLANRAWYQANRARVVTRSREWRRDNPARVATRLRKWRRDNPKKARAANRRYRRRHRLARATASREYAAKHPERIAANAAIEAAIRAGDIIRGPCFACESTENVQGHHEDYSRLFDVIWFCASCHQTYHHFMERLEKGEMK